MTYPEFRVSTPDGRNLIMADHDEDSLKRYLSYRGIRWTHIESYFEYEQEVEVREQQEKLNYEADLRAAVSTYTENIIEGGYLPSVNGFLREWPEYDHEELTDLIESEMARVMKLCEVAI